ncbi:MAG: hypothetical protein IJR34_04100 [Bacteroidales bacterium]|nr:hypothetical protein [Bacteroidales bacterium]
MTFEDILGDGRLWAVVYEEDKINILSKLFSQWQDPEYLYSFFSEHKNDLFSYFRVTDIAQAIYDTGQDANMLKAVILDLDPDTHLDYLFKPLENSRMSEMTLSKEKAKGRRLSGHPSWLRIYALKFEPDSYLITGGAIKLTRTMEERSHTLQELVRLEQVRNFLLEQGAVDLGGFIEYNNLTN